MRHGLQLRTTTRQRAFYFAWVALAIALGLGVRWRAVEGVFLADDWDHYAMHAQIYPVARGPLNMFDFVGESRAEHRALLRSGRLPWWTYPEIHLAVLRPLASALIVLDFSLFGVSPARFHWHSMLWWVVLMVGVAALLRSVLPLPIAAAGVLLYALDEAHGLPLSWIANRSAIVAVALGTWGLWAHVAYRRTAARGARALSLTLVALALFAGEYAFAVLAYFAAFELWGMREAPSLRARALLPVAVLGGCYLLLRAGLGYGIAGSGFYIDPFSTPLRYAVASMSRLPLLLGDLLFGFGAEWHEAGPPWQPWLLQAGVLPPGWLTLESSQAVQLTIGVVAAFAVAYLVWRLGRAPLSEHAPAARWLLLGGLLSLAPMCSTMPMSRLLLGAAIGVDAALGLLLWSALRAVVRASRWAPRIGFALLALPLLALHVAYATLRAQKEVDYYRFRSRLEEDWVLRAEIDDAVVASQRVMVIAARDWTSRWALPYVRHLYGHPMPKSVELLSAASEGRHGLLRVAPNVLELEIAGPAEPRTFSGSVYRPEVALFQPGDKLSCAHFDVEVLATAHGQPTRIRFVFPRSLDDPGYLFLYPQEEGLKRVALPGVGQQLGFDPPPWPSFAKK